MGLEIKNGYRYRCRPGYGSNKLLIEFISGVELKTFGDDLFDALKSINPNISGQTDLWMNDELLFHINSDKGHFTLSKDIWDLAFIMSEDNQSCISAIDDILTQDKRFEKIETDICKYKATGDASR